MSRELTIDNRDKDEIIQLLEYRIEALTKRIKELESSAPAVPATAEDYAIPC